MQAVTTEQARLYASTGEGELLVFTYYDGQILNGGDPLPLSDWSIDFDSTSAVQDSGTFTVADPSGLLVPTRYAAPLNPYGVRLRIVYRHTVSGLGGGVVSHPLGLFRLDDIPSLEEYLERYRNGLWGHRGAAIKAKFLGAPMADVEDWRLEAPVQPNATEALSTWKYLATLTQQNVLRNDAIADKPIPSSLTFQDSRLDAAYALARNLGGILYTTPDGSLSVRPDDAAANYDAPTWSAPYGRDGHVVIPPRSFSRANFYNIWISRSEATSDQSQIQGRASITDGPLREGGPMGRKPYFHTSPLITTQAAADADAATLKANFLASGRASETVIECLPYPPAQNGDVVQFGYFARTIAGVLTKFNLSKGSLMKATLMVPGKADPWAV